MSDDDLDRAAEMLENPPGTCTKHEVLMVLAEWFRVSPALLLSEIQMRDAQDD